MSGPAGYHAAVTARIESAELARYVAPGRALTRPHGLVVRLRASAAGRAVTGVGEAVVAGDRTVPAWRELQAVAAAVVGATLPETVHPSRPLARVRRWRPPAALDPGARRSAKLAMEMALLDAGRKLYGPGWWPARGGDGDPCTPDPRVTDWAVKLPLTGDDEVDVAALRRAAEAERRVAEAERRAEGARPLWLVGGDREPEAAKEFVRQLAALIADGEVPGPMLLEEPLATGPQSRLAKLRERTPLARFSGRRSPLRALQQSAGPQLSIVASRGIASVAHAVGLARSVRGLRLSLERFGTLAGLREAARAAKRANPALQVILAGDRGSRITAAALAALAAATPEIDRFAPDPPAGEWPELVPGSDATAEDARPAGFVGEVDLAELASVADELAAVPPVPVPAQQETPNTFPDYPMSGTALAVRSMLLETEALRLGLRTRRLARDFFLAEHPATGRVAGFFDSESPATSFAASAAAADKGITRALLSQAGLPLPPGEAFLPEQRDQAHRAGLALGFPLVVKPSGGSKGTAVTVGIETEVELAKALDEVVASKYAGTGIIVERYVTGVDYRVLATREQVLSVMRREPASVVGDGRRTVEELVLAANIARRRNPHLAKRLIVLDGRVDDQLARQQLTRRSVPDAGIRVPLRAEANLSLGGDSREVLDTAHPSLHELAVATVAAIPGLPYAGLDLLLEDHRRPVDAQQVSILEVNSRPVQSMHHFPMYGPPRNVSAQLVAGTLRDAGWRVAAPAGTLSVQLAVTGQTGGAPYLRWLAELATQLELSGWVTEDDGRVIVLARGPAPRVGLLLRMAFHGPAGAEVTQVCAEPVDTVPPAGFRVRKRPRGSGDGR